MAGKISVNQVQLGDSGTATNNFVWQTNVDGTCKLARGNAGETTQDILTVDADGRIAHGLPTGMVKVHTSNGFGSANTAIRRFTSLQLNIGADVIYTDSATLGASFTITKTGVYSVSYSDCFTGTLWFGISANSSQLSTAINAVTMSNVLALGNTLVANLGSNVSWTGGLEAGAILRPHATPTGIAGSGGNPVFTITRVA